MRNLWKNLLGWMAPALLAASCGLSHPDRLETALELAGDNRAELEQVLRHYADDSLKREAARFLIENMPYHYSLRGAPIDTLQAAFKQFHDSGFYNKKRFSCLRPFPHKNLSRFSDLRTITADYLIENIENGAAWHGGTAKAWANTSYSRILDPVCRSIFDGVVEI